MGVVGSRLRTAGSCLVTVTPAPGMRVAAGSKSAAVGSHGGVFALAEGHVSGSAVWHNPPASQRLTTLCCSIYASLFFFAMALKVICSSM